MAFKLKSGNTTNFKQMGSSPAKQKYDLSEATFVDKRSQEVIDKEKEEIKKEEEAKRKDQERIDQQIKGTYVETEEDVKKRKEEFRESGPRKKSPAKQAVGGDAGEAVSHWKKYTAAKNQDKAVEKLMTNKNISKADFEKKLSKITKTVKPKSTMPKNFNMTGKDSWVKRSKEILKKSAKKGGKVLGKRATGVLGLLGAGTLNATATNPHVKKSEGEQIKNLLTKHKLKGGKK